VLEFHKGNNMANYAFSRNHEISASVVGGTPAGISTAAACACGMSGGMESTNARAQAGGSRQSDNPLSV
jgi:hypothetical protein